MDVMNNDIYVEYPVKRNEIYEMFGVKSAFSLVIWLSSHISLFSLEF